MKSSPSPRPWTSLVLLAGLGCLSASCAKGPETAGGASGGSTGSGGDPGGATGGSTGSGGSGSGGAMACTTTGPVNGHPIAPCGYYVDGNKVYDSEGQVHVFRGLARPSLEWSFEGEMLGPSDYALMKGWGANIVRLSLNQDFWLPTAAQYNGGYQSNVARQVRWIEAAGMDVILDLHWSDKGNLALPKPAAGGNSQQDMADENSITFWQQVAEMFKGDGRVLFELYNEPKDISWEVWRNGGQVNGFMAAGMQQLHDAVRGTGAENIVIIGGIHFAYDLSGVTSNRIQGHNIMYAAHPYDFGDKQSGDWDRAFGNLGSTDPIFLTEFGSTSNCDGAYGQQVLSYAKSRGFSWTGWAWYVGSCTFPTLIKDWTGAPTTAGTYVQSVLKSP